MPSDGAVYTDGNMESRILSRCNSLAGDAAAARPDHRPVFGEAQLLAHHERARAVSGRPHEPWRRAPAVTNVRLGQTCPSEGFLL